MKYFIIIIHIILGLILIFLNGNNLLHLADLATQSPDNQYYYGISLFQGFTEAILGTILGLVSIVGAIAFRKDKNWAMLTLPLISLVVSGWIFFTSWVASRNAAEGFGSIAAGLQMMLGVVLFVFFIIESSYLIFKYQKTNELNL